MKRSRVQEQRFFPWAHEAHGLKFSILGGELDGRELELVDPRSHVLDLSSAWARARLELELGVPTAVARRVVAEHERDAPPLELLVALRCEPTRLRRRLGLLGWAEGEAGRFELSVELAREELAGQVELDAFLIRSRALAGSASGLASRAGAALASARPWLVQIDEPARHRGNYLDVQYLSFARDPGLPPARRAALYRLDLEREDPILYLNADHDRVRALLDNKGTRGRRARARELLYERIEAGVWTQLIVRAAARVAEDGELSYAWEQAILDQWLPRLYPDCVDEAARGERLRRDYQQLPGLLAELDLIVQVAGDLGVVATKLADELG